jgi:hypothetical protein
VIRATPTAGASRLCRTTTAATACDDDPILQPIATLTSVGCAPAAAAGRAATVLTGAAAAVETSDAPVSKLASAFTADKDC